MLLLFVDEVGKVGLVFVDALEEVGGIIPFSCSCSAVLGRLVAVLGEVSRLERLFEAVFFFWRSGVIRT